MSTPASASTSMTRVPCSPVVSSPGVKRIETVTGPRSRVCSRGGAAAVAVADSGDDVREHPGTAKTRAPMQVHRRAPSHPLWNHPRKQGKRVDGPPAIGQSLASRSRKKRVSGSTNDSPVSTSKTVDPVPRRCRSSLDSGRLGLSSS